MQGYDYSHTGAYFVTICALDRECGFGRIDGQAMVLSDVGRIVFDVWQELPQRFSAGVLDEFAIMPNHMHGILIIDDNHQGVARHR